MATLPKLSSAVEREQMTNRIRNMAQEQTDLMPAWRTLYAANAERENAKMYAYLRAGFTRDEAMQFMLKD